ncbi:uncharacterized protein LOC110963460 [Acanthochromis polyacanthus]|uniref:uncharacterized protein LOC110963460 n=1 Tax=Acanthochromis polyacanthus TaxID=80966 RepID=UPI00223493D8|nr:uncharacterized protein LOC110963460 [Acanthochromis polyacanthus]
MPRLQSGVWKHFTLAIKDGRETFMCNYCLRTYTKNATKMQMHLDKCKEFSVVSQRSPGPEGSSSASIPVPSYSFLPAASSGGQFLIDSVDQRSQALADECLARAVFASSSALSLTDNIYWKRFFGVLRPAYCPPTPEALSTHLLDDEYDRVRSVVHEAVRKADCVSIICSSWSDVNETGTVVYVVTTPFPLFYKSSKTKEFTAEELKDVISEVGPQKVFAVVTDDSPEMVSAWLQVEEAFPHISAIGCSAAAVHRLFDDIMKQPSMMSLCSRAEQVFRCLREQKIPAETSRSWKTTKLRKRSDRLELPDWTDVVTLLSCLLEDQNHLQNLTHTLDVDAPIRSTLQDEDFWKGLSSSRNLLYLVGSHLDFMRGEDAVLSGVVDMFGRLRYAIGATLSGSVLLSGEQEAVMASLDRCEEFCVKPIHTAAFMLDPKHAGQQTLSGEQISGAYSLISTLSQHLDLDEGKVLASFARFSARQGLWRGSGIWSSCQHVSPSTWWKGLCSSEPMSAVAFALLQIPPTTAACDRLRSHFNHAKTETLISAERLHKLVAVQTNLNLLEPLESEEEEKKVLCQSETKCEPM